MAALCGLASLAQAARPHEPEPSERAEARTWTWKTRAQHDLEAGFSVAVDARLAALPSMAESGEVQDKSLQRVMEFIAAQYPSARLSVEVRDPEAPAALSTVAAIAPSRSLIPASNQKIVTAAAAAELLGVDYRFETRVALDGDTLYLIGEGDPSLMIDDLHALAEQTVLQAPLADVRRIIVDDTAFAAPRFGPGYDPEDAGAAYQAPVGALSLNFNTVEVLGGTTPTVYPPSTAVDVMHDPKARAHAWSHEGEDGHTVIEVGGLRRGHKIRRRVSDPAMFTGGAFAHVLSELSEAEPLRVERGRAPATAEVVATHRSETLPSILEPALTYSNNFTSEQVLLTLAWRASNEPATFQEGQAVLERFVGALGVSSEQYDCVNGSGLSREGRASAHALTAVLTSSQRTDAPSSFIVSALAQPGRDGTLKQRLGWAGDKVRAKTGTMNRVSSLSGILRTRSGPRVFSILVNGVPAERARELQDTLVLAIAENG